MIWIFIILSNIVGWAVFTYADYLEETYEKNCITTVLIALIAFTTLVYFAIDLLAHRKQPVGLRRTALFLLQFTFTDIACTAIYHVMFANDLWLVEQETHGWDHLLNGLEYDIFAVFFPVCFSILVLLWQIIRTLRYAKAHNPTEAPQTEPNA